MKHGGAQSGILDGLLVESGLDYAWTTDADELHRRMMAMCKDWSADRTSGPDAFTFTQGVATAVLNTSTSGPTAPQTVFNPSDQSVRASTTATIDRWSAFTGASETLADKLHEGFCQPVWLDKSSTFKGTAVCKMFAETKHKGKLVSKGALTETWQALYEDGDREDYNWQELLPILASPPPSVTSPTPTLIITIKSSLVLLQQSASALGVSLPPELQPLQQELDTLSPDSALWWSLTQSLGVWSARWSAEEELTKKRLPEAAQQLWFELAHADAVPAPTVAAADNSMNRLETLDDLRAELSHMPRNSTSGMSGFTVNHCHCLPDAALSLVLLVTDCCFLGVFPDSFRLGVSLGISKSDKKFRPITLLETVIKLTAGTINRRVMRALYENDVLQCNQFGNVIGGSTNTPLRMTITMYEHARRHNLPLHIAYLDLSTAFDSTPHNWLELAINTILGSTKLARWVREMCFQQKRRVQHSYGLSSADDAVELTGGVPQGSPISPLLFLLVTELVLRALHRNNKDGVVLNATAHRS